MDKEVKITRKDGLIKVTSPYDADFIQTAKGLGGKWNSSDRTWDIPGDMEEGVAIALNKYYDYVEDRVIEYVYVEYKAEDFTWHYVKVPDSQSIIKIDNKTTAKRFFKNDEVVLFDTYVIEGGFPASGGSAKYPELEYEEGTILRTKLEKHKYERLPDDEKKKLKLVEVENQKSVLERRKIKLLEELEEIEEELKKFK